MNRDEGATLDDFAVRANHLSKMTGIHLAVHAIPDALLLMHAGVGCKYKTGAQTAQHDWVNHANEREAWTQIGDQQLIEGAGVRIGPFARSWYDRRRPAFMVLTSAYFLELTGEGGDNEVDKVEETLPCPLVYIPTVAPNNGFYGGYAQTMMEVASRQPWDRPPTEPGQSTALGFFFSRYEQDCLADVSVLRRLAKVAGAPLGPVLFSGRPFAELSEGWRSGLVLQLPYAKPAARELKDLLTKRRVVQTDLPMGVGGTGRWLREVCAGAGGNRPVVDAWIQRESARVKRLQDIVRQRMVGLRVALFADTPYAAGMATILRELGIEILTVGLRDSCLGGEAGFRETLARNGVSLNEDCTVLEKPSLRAVRDNVLPLVTSRRLRLIMGSTSEVNALGHEEPLMLRMGGAELVEIGYPSSGRHCIAPSPSLGFKGVVYWAQRFLDLHIDLPMRA